MTAATVPQLSISMEEAKVSRWLVEDGEPVRAGQLLVEVETDKATVEIEAPAAGVLRIVAAEGAIVPVEGVLAELDDGNGPTPSAGRAVTEPEPLSPAWSDANGASVAGGQARRGADRVPRCPTARA